MVCDVGIGCNVWRHFAAGCR